MRSVKQASGSRVASRAGMTLVEVLAVVVILGLLAATLAVGFSGLVGRGKTEIARTGVGVLAERVGAYHLAENEWPESLDTLSIGSASPSDPYFVPDSSLVDPWGNPYVLIVPGPDGFPFEVVSYGSDNAEGGTGEAADISSVNLRASG